MNRSACAVVFVLLFPAIICAQSPALQFASVAATGVAQSSAWSVVQNPAGLAHIISTQLAVNYENPLAIQNLGVKAASLALPFNAGAVAAFARAQGFDSYKQVQASLAYGRNFGERLSIGLTANYYQTSIISYGSVANISVNTGVQYHINEQFTMGACAENVLQNKPAPNAELLPRRLSAGIQYSATELVVLHAEIEHNDFVPLTGRLALSYRPAEKFALRGGLDLKPFSQFAAFGFVWKNLAFNMACTSHQALGITPSIGLGYAF